MGVCSHQCGHKHHCQHTYPSHRYKEICSTLCTIAVPRLFSDGPRPSSLSGRRFFKTPHLSAAHPWASLKFH